MAYRIYCCYAYFFACSECSFYSKRDRAETSGGKDGSSFIKQVHAASAPTSGRVLRSEVCGRYPDTSDGERDDHVYFDDAARTFIDKYFDAHTVCCCDVFL